MKPNRIFTAILWTVLLPISLAGQPNWHAQTSPIQDDLVSVSFSDSLTGWAVSDSGTVIHTIDGGLTWEIQQTLDRFEPGKIFFQDKLTGWMAGVNSSANDTAFIMKTADGGATWDTSFFLLNAKIFDIFFINDTMGWAVGFIGDTLGLRLHTLDAGETWAVESGINIIAIYTGVHFRDTDTGDICGDGPVMMHTISGGRGESPWAMDIFNLKKPMYDLVNVGELYGCMVGADGKLFFTKDRWVNFMEYDYEPGDTLWSVDAIDPLGFWVVGEAGTILFVGYNQFLGLTVQDQSQDIQQDLLDLVAIDDAHAWTVGKEGTILFFGFDPSSGINAPAISGIQVFPNPATDHIRVHNLGKGVDHIELYNMQGKLISTSLVPRGQTNFVISLGGMYPGAYILKAGEQQRQFVIIQP